MPSSRVNAPLTTMAFADLVRWKYTASGISQDRWVAQLVIEAGICRHSLLAAFKGLRVSRKTARALLIWAAKTHFVDIDEPALLNGPTRPPRNRSVTSTNERCAARGSMRSEV